MSPAKQIPAAGRKPIIPTDLPPAPQAPAPDEEARIEYIRLGDLQRWDRNPKDHDIPTIKRSINRFGFVMPILVDDRSSKIVAGHGRLDSLTELKAAGGDPPKRIKKAADGEWLVPILRGVTFNSDREVEAYLIADNQLTILGGWDAPGLASMLADLAADGDQALIGTGFGQAELDALLTSLGNQDLSDRQAKEQARSTLAGQFIVPPFTVLDARQGYWQERKRAWIDLGIKGEEGRGDNLLKFSETAQIKRGSRRRRPDAAAFTSQADLDAYKAGSKKPFGQTFGSGSPAALGKLYKGLGEDEDDRTGTSIFDPVLCEIAYRWFCPPGGSVFDPFAGEATKGIVAACLGLSYTGVELRKEQVEANRRQWEDLTPWSANPDRPLIPPTWIEGDSSKIDQIVPADNRYDLIFTSPPYYDLEIYSDDDRDGSAFESYPIFMDFYNDVFRQSVARLADNRFLVVKIGDIRDERGVYRNFLGDNIKCFIDLGLQYYNEAVLVTALGSLPIRVGKQFRSNRKLGKTHQNILVFYKGDPARIKDIFPQEIEYADISE